MRMIVSVASTGADRVDQDQSDRACRLSTFKVVLWLRLHKMMGLPTKLAQG